MKGHILSAEQMHQLKKLGHDTSDASWAWVQNGDVVELMPHAYAKRYAKAEHIIPTYDAIDLLHILNNPWLHYNEEIEEYVANDGTSVGVTFAATPLEALYKHVVWLLKNGFGDDLNSAQHAHNEFSRD